MSAPAAVPTLNQLFHWYEAQRDALLAAGHGGRWMLVWFGHSAQHPPPAELAYRFELFDDEQEMMGWMADPAHYCSSLFYVNQLGQEGQSRQKTRPGRRGRAVTVLSLEEATQTPPLSRDGKAAHD